MNKVIEQWHHIIQSKDTTALNALLSDDVVFYSPVVHTPQKGKLLTYMYLHAAANTLINESFKYVKEIIGDQHAVLEFEVEIDGMYLNGIDMISWNENNQITEFKVMIRPLKAVHLIHEKMSQMLAKLNG